MPEIYSIKTNDLYGRYLVAGKNIKAGEIILQEEPTFVGSQIQAKHICFKCCKNLSQTVQICDGCKVATVFEPDCSGSKHADPECDTFKKTGLKTIDIINKPQIVMPLRCLLTREYNTKLWETIMSLESHVELRRDTGIWKTHKISVEDAFKDLKIINADDLKDEIVQKICGLLDVNTFELRPPQASSFMVNSTDCLRGLYLKASLMAHDCIGNTHLCIDDDLRMTVHAGVDIKEGETIFFNYSSCLKGTYERRVHLKTGKYFHCNCKRCSDPTELGTYMSAVKCPKCKNGFCVPSTEIADMYATQWICENCQVALRGRMVRSTVQVASEKIANLDPTNLIEAETLLKNLMLTLPENHYLILELKQNMIPIYEQNIYTDWAMQRKIEMCEDIIKLLAVLEPGISRLQGIALYQLHGTQVNLANKQFQNREIPQEKYLAMLTAAEDTLSKSIKNLVYEPKNSPEGRLVQHAFNDLRIIRGILKQLRSTSGTKLTSKEDVLGDLLGKKKTNKR